MKTKDNQDLTVVKSNRLVEAAYRMTLVEQRIILLAVTFARKSGKGLSPLDFVTIKASDYLEFYGDGHNVYEQLKEAARLLFLREFTLYAKDNETGKKKVINGRWLSAASYIDDAGTIELQFSPLVIPYITTLERDFTKYKLEKIADLSSPYAIRLYELLMQWKNVGTREVEIAWLKKIFMLEDKYQSIKDLKRRVIDSAVAQINKHTNLTVSYEQRKTGRVVSHFIFSCAEKANTAGDAAVPSQRPVVPVELSKSAQAPQAPPERPQTASKPLPAAVVEAQQLWESELFQRLRKHGIGEKLALTWLRQDEVRVKNALDYTEERARQGHIKGSLAGYLRKLFESGNEIGRSLFEQAAAQRKAAEQARQEQERLERKRHDEQDAQRRISGRGMPSHIRAEFDRIFGRSSNPS